MKPDFGTLILVIEKPPQKVYGVGLDELKRVVGLRRMIDAHNFKADIVVALTCTASAAEEVEKPRTAVM